MNAIVSVTADWGIGNKGALIVRNRDDMRRFVQLTMGGTVLMGRTTFESFPGGPLKGRRNVVLTSKPTYEATHPGIECVHTIRAARELISRDGYEPVWLIGGESVYRALLDSCERCYVTKNHTLAPADAYFPNLDDDPSWVLEHIEDGGVTPEGIAFDFATYHNTQLRR